MRDRPDYWTCPETGDTLFRCAQSGLVRNLTQEQAREAAQSKALRLAAIALERSEIERIMARYQLEPDEFQSAEDKARAYLPARRKRR